MREIFVTRSVKAPFVCPGKYLGNWSCIAVSIPIEEQSFFMLFANRLEFTYVHCKFTEENASFGSFLHETCKMAEYDLTSKVGQYLDRHLVFPLIEFLSGKEVRTVW